MNLVKRIVILLILIIVANIDTVNADEIILHTYYPAPYGVYKELDVHYLDFKNDLYDEDAGITPDAEEARVFYDKEAHQFKYHDGTDWRPFGESLWKLNPNSPPNRADIYYDDGNVGIRTDEPGAALTFNGSFLRAGSEILEDTQTNIILGAQSSITLSEQPLWSSVYYCVLGGGNNHIINLSSGCLGMEGILGLNTISGGVQNEQEMSGAATIKGGRENSIFGDASAIGGGWQNKVENHHSSVIIGGFSNSIPLPSIGPGVCGTLLGGNSNTGGMIFGGEECAVLTRNSWGGGRQAQVLAGPPGSLGNRDSFVWADSQDAAYPSNGPFTFNIRAQGGVYYGAPPPKWWDIAEEMVVHKADNLQEAELVSLSGNDILAKTKVAYDENLIGVVTGSRTTTMHFQSIGEPEDLKLEEKYITLVGRVYVKVNNENGPIKVGSPITSSSVPGIGMQATRPAKIIGYAMTEANFTDSDTEEVLVFANLGYYVPQEAFAALQDRLASLKKKVNKLKKIALR